VPLRPTPFPMRLALRTVGQSVFDIRQSCTELTRMCELGSATRRDLTVGVQTG
jgi:hypothetical protein